MIYTESNPPECSFFNKYGEEIKLGMLVHAYEDGREVTGEVVVLETNSYYEFGVLSDDVEFNGHDLSGVLRGKNRSRGWWCSHVEPVMEDTDVSIGDFQDFLS